MFFCHLSNGEQLFDSCLLPKNAKPCQNGVSKRVNSLSTRDEIAEFANIVDLDEVAHNEPPHLHLHCLPSSL